MPHVHRAPFSNRVHARFGHDLGYSSNTGCTSGEGYGYWPPGPECPFETEKYHYLPLDPSPAEGSWCAIAMAEIATLANGASVYGWSDGQYYSSNTWSNIAACFEYYDVDVCGGHAANGDYHNHGTGPRTAGCHLATFRLPNTEGAGTPKHFRFRVAVALR